MQRTAIGDQTVDARLWQDPFEAIRDSVAQSRTNVPAAAGPGALAETNVFSAGFLHLMAEMARQIERQADSIEAGDSTCTNIVVFQVMVSGGPYAENAESRRRSRYAVVSALLAAGYTPFDEEHLGWFHVPWPRSAKFEASAIRSQRKKTSTLTLPSLEHYTQEERWLSVPFEWFECSRHKGDGTQTQNGAVLVWWLCDDAFQDHPLLLLQSLHKQFPDAIFFTTDLDARLFHPSQWKWSRNLIVASSFGLQLGKDLQGNAPPFRDSYQTGEYLACLAALGNSQALTNLTSIGARIFEVGRRGAYALDVGAKEENPFYRARPAALGPPWLALGMVTVCLLAAAYLGWSYFPASMARYWSNKQLRLRVLVFLVVLLIGCIAVWWMIWTQDRDPEGEPFSVFDGLSLWPCEIMRLAGAALAVALFVIALFQLRDSNDRLGEEFQLTVPSASPAARLWKGSLRGSSTVRLRVERTSKGRWRE